MKWGGWWYLPTSIPHEERPAWVEALVSQLRLDARNHHPSLRQGKPMVRFRKPETFFDWLLPADLRPAGSPDPIPEGMLVVYVSLPLIGAAP